MTLLQGFLPFGPVPHLCPSCSKANPNPPPIGLPFSARRGFHSAAKPPSLITVAAARKNLNPEGGGGAEPRERRETELPAKVPPPMMRGRRSEAAAVEDFVRDSLERTFAEIRRQSSEVLEGKEEVLKARAEGPDDGGGGAEEGVVVEEEAPEWPADAEVGWGIRASEYFDKHPIRNVVAGGVEIDWEGDLEEGLVKEINCLEWESFAFHPSPLIVLVFERYNRPAENWKLLKELEKAAVVYWNAKDRLPPRTVKIDMNIETDLAYALKVRECPQLLFLRGNRILYREKEMRTADELVQMIAHFYYNARRPSWVDPANVAPAPRY
ncbi:unnamed protein product [Spirodela intermedia]|uniref:Uncharacterized protein n=1 Tax=Spirodela intermedia TaxID=51605 RepID=A0A7I8IRV6_SPIIN|nr:unnamed protein product [Spirodela intermedia]CAA6660286.1 unnamed protein product [Spirodela intermedia]